MLKIWRKTLLIIGLLHPIVVTSDNILIAGARRLAAVKALGWEEVPVNLIDLQQITKGAFAENIFRKDSCDLNFQTSLGRRGADQLDHGKTVCERSMAE